MNEEPALPVTPTHSGVEAKGTILGLEGRTVVPVLGATVLSILLLALNTSGSSEGMIGRWVISLLPVVVTTAYVLCLVHRRPPHYARDWWEVLRVRLLSCVGCDVEGLGFHTQPVGLPSRGAKVIGREQGGRGNGQFAG